jgi:hypothetical protein
MRVHQSGQLAGSLGVHVLLPYAVSKQPDELEELEIYNCQQLKTTLVIAAVAHHLRSPGCAVVRSNTAEVLPQSTSRCTHASYVM